MVKEISHRVRYLIYNEFKDHKDDLIKLNNKKLDRTQKTRKIRSYLKKRRFPALSKAENEFKINVKELKLGSGAKLIPPNNFEGNTYTLSLYFKNKKELNDRLAILEKIVKNPVFGKILG